MNINVYLEEGLAKELTYYAKIEGKPRNAIIREAVKEWIVHHKVQQWSELILKFKEVKDFTPFESARTELKPPKDDPLA